MAIYDFFLSRNGAPVNRTNYVGNKGRLFYDDDTGEIRLSDGVIPGGLPIPITVASETVTGAIRLGPGITLNNDDQIVIDSTGLDFTFGDFEATIQQIASTDIAVLSSSKLDEDIIIESNGTGSVDVVGEFHVHKTDGTLEAALSALPLFSVAPDGKIKMIATSDDPAAGAVEITGNTDGSFYPPNLTGTTLHVTGRASTRNRIYFDASNDYPVIVGRRYNGTFDAITPVLQDDIIMAIAAQGAVSSSGFNSRGPARIAVIATENHTPTTQGGEIIFQVTPNGVPADTGRVDLVKFNADTGVAINSALTVTGLSSLGTFNGKYIRNYRDAGVIPDAGTLTIDFAADTIVKCEWDNNFTINYVNFTAGAVVKVIVFKRAGTGTDNLSLDGITPGNVSTGSTTVSSTADRSTFIEYTCTGSTIDSVFAKL